MKFVTSVDSFFHVRFPYSRQRLLDNILPIVEFLSKFESVFSNSPASLLTKFMSYYKSFVFISTIFTACSSRADSVSRNYLLCSSIRSSSSFKFSHEIAAIQSHLQAAFLILVLLLFPAHLQVILPLKFFVCFFFCLFVCFVFACIFSFLKLLFLLYKFFFSSPKSGTAGSYGSSIYI